MAILLSLESSAELCSAALSIDGVTQLKLHEQPRQHAQLLLPMVDQLLNEADLTLADIKAIAFSRGPGSFTGIRICMSVVQGLALGQSIPVIPVSTLQALAMAVQLRGLVCVGETVTPAFDARMNEVYIGRYQLTNDVPQSLEDEQVLPTEIAANQFAGLPGLAVGSGWHTPAMAASRPEQQRPNIAITAQHIDAVAQRLYERNATVAVENASPVYLRNEITWKKRETIRQRNAGV